MNTSKEDILARSLSNSAYFDGEAFTATLNNAITIKPHMFPMFAGLQIKLATREYFEELNTCERDSDFRKFQLSLSGFDPKFNLG